jgi:hypothetical protein
MVGPAPRENVILRPPPGMAIQEMASLLLIPLFDSPGAFRFVRPFAKVCALRTIVPELIRNHKAQETRQWLYIKKRQQRYGLV